MKRTAVRKRVLLHDSACPHTAAHTFETNKKLNFEVLEHPLYSLNLHLFRLTCLVHLNKPLEAVSLPQTRN